MSLFKKRTSFPQFVADLISFQCDFLASNFERMIALADEPKALTDRDKQELIEKTHDLVMVDILMSCKRCFCETLSGDAVNEAVSTIYAKYLTEHKRMAIPLAEQKLQSVLVLYRLVAKAEKETETRQAKCREAGYTSFPKVSDPTRAQQLYLCRAFAEYCAGNDMKATGWEGKHFAAFKLAMGLVTGDIVATVLRQYKIAF
jgi:hypothetical protein